MPLAMPQPDFEPALRLHLSAFHARLAVDPGRFVGPGDEDEDNEPSKLRAARVTCSSSTEIADKQAPPKRTRGAFDLLRRGT